MWVLLSQLLDLLAWHALPIPSSFFSPIRLAFGQMDDKRVNAGKDHSFSSPFFSSLFFFPLSLSLSFPPLSDAPRCAFSGPHQPESVLARSALDLFSTPACIRVSSYLRSVLSSPSRLVYTTSLGLRVFHYSRKSL